MNPNKPVPLERHFSVVPRSESDSDEQQILKTLGDQNDRTWSEIDKRYRTVILAEAGAGKTHEMSARAKAIENTGRHAFFIRIEDIAGDFKQAFEVGSEEGFNQWLSSQDEAWFFLDSVDEARLSDPRDFEKAIRRFAHAINSAQLRAHIYISSRPYAWRPKSDRELIDVYLPFKKPQTEATDPDSKPDERSKSTENELEIFQLNPLDEDDIRLFAEHRLVLEIDHLIEEIQRSNIMSLAERPFDLEGILDKWKTDNRTLGNRSELLEHNIQLGLDETAPDNKIRRPLELEKAREGARMLAAAVILCDKPGIQVPEDTYERTGIQANAILPDWKPHDIQMLLERAIFNDVVYGSVRFRHRDIREFLAAEWLIKLLEKETARCAIETLIFREQYGEVIVSPRLRPILPWLILKDKNIRNRALDIHPEIAVEGGDPARLPLSERKSILNGILAGIVETNKRTAQDNSAIARIAQPDLADETLSLIERHGQHDDAVFFLGRLVWQGKMLKCVPPLLAIAIDPKRGTSARMAATRAVMSCGTDEQRSSLWSALLTDQAEIPRNLLAELLHRISADQEGVSNLLAAVEMLSPYNRFEVTGLQQALHGYIDRLPVSDSDVTQPMAKLVDGLVGILDRPPHTEQLSYRISQEFQWLLGPSIHAVERLVAAHADEAMQDSTLEILLNSPAIRELIGEHYDIYKDRLRELVPAWPELNDILFWRRVEKKRACLEEGGDRLINFFQIDWPDHYWSFGPDSFLRVLDWLIVNDLEDDDRHVAFLLAYHIFREAGQPTDWFDKLQAAVKDDAALEVQLHELQNPTISAEQLEWQQQELQRKEEFERQRRQKENKRSDWISDLKSNPDLIRNPPQLNPGEMSYDQYYLMREIEGNGLRTSHARGADWEFLIDKFGYDVASAYRDAAMSHWRRYNPSLPSEGADTSSIQDSLLFAIAGLEIEARKHSNFPTHLNESEIHHALRYITWEINGFPSWLKTMYRAKPQLVMEAIQTEIYWELDNTKPDQKSHGLLHDLMYYAPWLHQALIEPIVAWLRKNDPSNVDTQRYCLHILKSGGMDEDELGILARNKATTPESAEPLSQWYAIWVDVQPDSGIPALSNQLSKLDAEHGSYFAQLFIAALMGIRSYSTGPNLERFRTPGHLKTLYVLMHKYICVENDIHRANTGVYSPNLRDHAQRGRDKIFSLLSEIPGKETHVALTELTEQHPNPGYRPWMKELAYMRAEKDGDLEPWTAEQVHEFDSRLTRTPATQRQLFDLTVDCLVGMKDWLEHGDTSPYVTWQRAQTEPEMRILIAGTLEQNAENRFTISQEDEVANRQRMDIRMHSQDSGHPIPIELKLLDKGWTGPKLCERLHNQLAGNYLREGNERYGIMLLVRQGTTPARKWKIDGKLTDVSTLENALKQYWIKISDCYPKVSNIQIIVVDLTLRATKS